MRMIESETFILLILGILSLLVVYTNVLKIQKNAFQSLIFIVLFPLLVVLTATIFLIYILGWTVSKLITLYLKIRYRSKFIGLVKDMDVAHASNKAQDSLMMALFIIEYNSEPHEKGLLEHIHQLVVKHIVQNGKYFPKLLCTLRTFMGYPFMTITEFNIDDCIKKLTYNTNEKIKIEKPELLKIISEYYHEPLPQNGTLWDLHVGTYPINWKKNVDETTRYYPVLLRCHHVIGDGINLIKLFCGMIADKNDVIVNMSHSKQKSTNTFIDCLRNFVRYFYLAILLPSAIFSMFISKGNDSNILHEKPYIGKETMAVGNDETGAYFKKIKNIKRKCPGFSVPEILITVFSQSLKDYYHKNSVNAVKCVTAAVPMVSNYNAHYTTAHGNLNPENFNLRNNYVPLLLTVPISIENEVGFNKNIPLTSRLRFVKKETNALKNSVEFEAGYILTHIICGVLPTCMVRVAFSIFSKITCILSLLPGPSQITLSNEILVLADCNVFVPHLMNCGVCFSSITYDNRLNLGINIEGTYISNQEEAQEIIDNTYKYIDVLDAEID